MYITSSVYRASLDSGYLDTDIKGTITLTNGTCYEFEEKDLIPSSLSYDNRALNGNDFNFGGVYVGELSIDLLLSIDRYSLNEAEIKVSYYQTTLSGEVQEIPLGIFYVYEAKRTRKIISLKAYDAMIKFDAKVDENTSGVMFDILSYISDKCGVPLAQTENEISSFTNAEWWLTLDNEHISTYREAISQIGLLSGQFATIDRFGRLVFREFQTEIAQDSISARRRTESSIQDFKTFFCGVKARFLANTNYYPYTAIDESIEKGLVLDLGDIPLFMGEDTTKKTIMSNLLVKVTNLSYVPAEFSTISDPSVDLGDRLVLKDVNCSDASVVTIVHSFSWKYHGTQKIVCYGLDPRIAGVVSREEKLLSQVESQLSSKDIVVKTYTNSKRIVVNDQKEQEVFLFNFAATNSTTVMFMGTIPFDASMDGVIILRTYLDGVVDATATVRKYVSRGNNMVTITNYFPIKNEGRTTLKITMETEYFESDARIQESKIVSLLNYAQNQNVEVDAKGVPHLAVEYEQTEIDTTPLTVGIKQSSIKGLLFAQGIAGAGQWDGTINLADDFKSIMFHSLLFNVSNMGENILVKKQAPIVVDLDDEMKTTFAGGVEYKVTSIGEKVGISEEDVPTAIASEVFRKLQIDLYFTLNKMNGGISIATEEEEE